MSIILKMKTIFSVLLFLLTIGLFAAPLESGYPLAPRSSASSEERARAYMDARRRVIEASRKYEGTPYAYGSMTASGLDCSGFICISFRDAIGVSMPRSASGLYTWSERIALDRAQPGDLLFFRTDPSTRNITHVALYLGGRRFIHAASSGARTGVIYSDLDEAYWANAYAGAGRAFPEAPASFTIDGNSPAASAAPSSRAVRSPAAPAPSSPNRNGRLLVGFAFAPTWNGFIKDGDLVRGFASHFCFVADTNDFGKPMVFGLEVRPEYDGALGVFRLPITLSWGPSEEFKIFAGPVISFGDASLSVEGEKRRYSGGTSWLGTIGITAAPFTFDTPSGHFAIYLEAAWQSYFSDNAKFEIASDFSAGFRFSTGLRWTVQVNK